MIRWDTIWNNLIRYEMTWCDVTRCHIISASFGFQTMSLFTSDPRCFIVFIVVVQQQQQQLGSAARRAWEAARSRAADDSVNRPWHRSGPTAAASTWIMHGGKFWKKEKGKKKRLPASRRFHWERDGERGSSASGGSHGRIQRRAASQRHIASLALRPR